MDTITPRAQHARRIVDALNDKFSGEHTFTVDSAGRKFARVAVHPSPHPSHLSALLFVDDDGLVYKAAGWRAPAAGVRFSAASEPGLDELVSRADPYGSFLYR